MGPKQTEYWPTFPVWKGRPLPHPIPARRGTRRTIVLNLELFSVDMRPRELRERKMGSREAAQLSFKQSVREIAAFHVLSHLSEQTEAPRLQFFTSLTHCKEVTVQRFLRDKSGYDSQGCQQSTGALALSEWAQWLRKKEIKH